MRRLLMLGLWSIVLLAIPLGFWRRGELAIQCRPSANGGYTFRVDGAERFCPQWRWWPIEAPFAAIEAECRETLGLPQGTPVDYVSATHRGDIWACDVKLPKLW